ncbi:hypothetical protein [Actinopolyspora halophila]|uniref:hypothetical protein n=1 Tax=Actinopolyspora halophila TaxID=1850 RepID=UPI000377F578|nr:hypothetical protein [Actinopolyspora halophila]
MGDLASLIAAVASLITAIGGVAGMIINARQQRRDAAASPIDELQDKRLRELEEAVRDTDDTGGDP